MIKIGDMVKVTKQTINDYAFDTSFTIGKVYKVVGINDTTTRPLEYQLQLDSETIICFDRSEIELHIPN